MPIGYTPTGVVFTSYTYYGNYMVRTKVANYDAITGGYHSNGISSAAADPSYYALNYEPTVRDYQATRKDLDNIDDSSDAVEGTQDAPKATKKTTNPNGRKGSPENQKVIGEEKQKLRDKGYKIEDKEVQVKTQGGKKNSRYPDITATDLVTGEKSYVQVGKSNTKGPINTYEGAVKRERDAIDDLVNYGGIRREQIRFVTYKQ